MISRLSTYTCNQVNFLTTIIVFNFKFVNSHISCTYSIWVKCLSKKKYLLVFEWWRLSYQNNLCITTLLILQARSIGGGASFFLAATIFLRYTTTAPHPQPTDFGKLNFIHACQDFSDKSDPPPPLLKSDATCLHVFVGLHGFKHAFKPESLILVFSSKYSFHEDLKIRCYLNSFYYMIDVINAEGLCKDWIN